MGGRSLRLLSWLLIQVFHRCVLDLVFDPDGVGGGSMRSTLRAVTFLSLSGIVVLTLELALGFILISLSIDEC